MTKGPEGHRATEMTNEEYKEIRREDDRRRNEAIVMELTEFAEELPNLVEKKGFLWILNQCLNHLGPGPKIYAERDALRDDLNALSKNNGTTIEQMVEVIRKKYLAEAELYRKELETSEDKR